MGYKRVPTGAYRQNPIDMPISRLPLFDGYVEYVRLSVNT